MPVSNVRVKCVESNIQRKSTIDNVEDYQLEDIYFDTEASDIDYCDVCIICVRIPVTVD